MKIIRKIDPDYNYLSEADYSDNFPQLFIYPRKVEIDFSLYEHEIRSNDNRRLIHWGDHKIFLEEEYINDIEKSQANSIYLQGTIPTYNTVSSNGDQRNIVPGNEIKKSSSSKAYVHQENTVISMNWILQALTIKNKM